MWVVQIDDLIAEESGVLPTGASDRSATEPVMVGFLHQWATTHELDLNTLHVHLCTGEEHGHPPRLLVGEVDDNGDPVKLLLELNAFEITRMVSSSRPLQLLQHVFGAGAAVADISELTIEPLSKTVH